MMEIRKEYQGVFERIEEVLQRAGDRTVRIAIDGMCASGKTTLAEVLRQRYDCNVFHMDDFFLRPEQRTPERYAEPGGNVDRERFQEEVLNHLDDRAGFSYQLYSCAKQALDAWVPVQYHQLNIIEGAYSLHPAFGDIYDLRFYYGIDPQEQLDRILERNGEEKLKMFIERWIPMENRYLETFHIPEKCISIR